jgi:hypothetical protein
MPFISAFYWTTYGNDFQYMFQQQYSGLSGNLDLGVLNYSTSYGQRGYALNQPLVSPLTFSDGEDDYIIIKDLDTIRILDEDLLQKTSLNTGYNILGSMDIMDFFSTGKNDIVAFLSINSSLGSLNVYSINTTNNNLYVTYSKNYSVSGLTINGIRHFGNNLIFTLNTPNNIINIVNQTGFTTINVTTHQANEPIAFGDFDNDGNLEFILWSVNSVRIYRSDGSTMFSYDKPAGCGTNEITDVKPFQTTGSSWKIAILVAERSVCGGGTLFVKNIDGSSFWSYGFPSRQLTSRLAVADDFDGDGLNDIYVAFSTTYYTSFYNDQIHLYVLNGKNGNLLDSYSTANARFGFCANLYYQTSTLTIADMNNDGKKEFVYSLSNIHLVYDMVNNREIINDTINYHGQCSTAGEPYISSCISADINANNYLEIVCSGRDYTRVFYYSPPNYNPIINSVTYSPSTHIKPNNKVFVEIDATDPESETIYYNHKCYNGDTWKYENTNNFRNCTYYIEGVYNLTVGVIDDSHSDYNTYSQLIYVNYTGDSSNCDYDSICDIDESYPSCSDCPFVESEYNPIQSIDIPTQIVNVTDINQGLLPEVYYGLVAFMSYSLRPVLIMVFVILIALIIFSVFAFIRNFVKRF